MFLPHFDVICDLLLNRRTATWNLFVKKQSSLGDSSHAYNYKQGRTNLVKFRLKSFKSHRWLESHYKNHLKIYCQQRVTKHLRYSAADLSYEITL